MYTYIHIYIYIHNNSNSNSHRTGRLPGAFVFSRETAFLFNGPRRSLRRGNAMWHIWYPMARRDTYCTIQPCKAVSFQGGF